MKSKLNAINSTRAEDLISVVGVQISLALGFRLGIRPPSPYFFDFGMVCVKREVFGGGGEVNLPTGQRTASS